jgi:hypothetical protein
MSSVAAVAFFFCAHAKFSAGADAANLEISHNNASGSLTEVPRKSDHRGLKTRPHDGSVSLTRFDSKGKIADARQSPRELWTRLPPDALKVTGSN